MKAECYVRLKCVVCGRYGSLDEMRRHVAHSGHMVVRFTRDCEVATMVGVRERAVR